MSLLDWIDDRTGYRGLTKAALYEHIPGGARWRYVWGSTLVFAFVTQLVTGFFLWMNYSPSSQTAWESVYFIQHQMAGGAWLRGIHHFMAQAMIVLLALHLMQVVIDGAYRAPREFNFWIGLCLLMITLGLGLTGYLLPWDQRGFWSTKVATNIMGSVPVVGPYVQRLAIGGTEYGHHTLTRFFALHAGLLPLLMILLTFVHVALFRKHGLTYKQPKRGADATFWVDQVLRDAVACLAVLATVLFLVSWPRLTGKGYWGAELSAPADPSSAFSAARPEWYFLFLFQFLKLPAFAGHNEVYGAVVIPGIVFLVMALMPITGRLRVGHWFNVAFTTLLFTGIVLLTMMAVVQDAGRPTLHVPVVGSLGYGVGMVLLGLMLLGTLVLFILLSTGGHPRAYARGLVGLGVMILLAGLLILWTVAGDHRLGSQPWSIGGFTVEPGVQVWLMLGLLALVALLTTLGMMREPYSMRDVAGYSHRWQWLHRGRLGMLMLLVGAVVLIAAFNVLEASGDRNYQKAVAQAREDSERAVELAGAGIPPTGAVSLVRLDPKLQGPRYFQRYCASCHRYGGTDGMGGTPADPQSAFDLKGFATREWVAGLLDPKQVDSVKYFGPGMAAHDGPMVKVVKEDIAEADQEEKKAIPKIVAALAAEAQLTSKVDEDRRQYVTIQEGRTAMVGTKDMDLPFTCTKCHTFREKQASRGASNRSRGPELTGYGSRQWMIDFIRNPVHPRFYPAHNDRMPAYGQQKILSDAEIALIVDWLRGDWTEPGRPWDPPAILAAMTTTPPAAATPRPAAGSSDAGEEKKGDNNTPAKKPSAQADRAAGAEKSSPPATAPTTSAADSKPSADTSTDKSPTAEAPKSSNPTTAPATQPTTNPSSAPATAPATSQPLDTLPPPKPESSSALPLRRTGALLAPFRLPALLLATPPATVPARPAPPATAPAPAGKVDFAAHVKPILESRCVKCHGPVRPTNGYRIYTREFAFKPGDSDEDPIVPGKAKLSHLYQLITAKDPDHRMPQKGPPLAPEQIATIQRWIDQGANWPESVQLDTSAAKEEGGKKK
jgi:quinol-cytochrome oxidoreductase complex cytochrome b subunit/mono/diheme cytochrome c family protein